MQEEKKGLILNLCTLGFDIQAQEATYGCQFDENTFYKSNKRAFEVTTHFLFHKLDRKQANELFRTCFPGTGKKCAQDFRRVSFNWLKKISEENGNFGLPKVTSTMLMAPGGKDFIHLMFKFSTYVLYKCLVKIQPDGVLLPPILSSSKRANAQVKVLEALSYRGFQDFVQLSQIVKKTEEEFQSFAETQINSYHSLQKKKKFLLQKKRQLLGSAAQYSDVKLADYMNQQRRKLVGKVNSVQESWSLLSECLENTSPHREVMNSVLSKDVKETKIDGNKLQPTVPARLLDDFQEEIFQTVGTSLYENGKVNLASLVSLQSLSLSLILDSLHEDGLPNYEKQNSWLQTQNQIHSNQLENLLEVRSRMAVESQTVKSQIKALESELDDIYASSVTSPDPIFEPGSDVADSNVKQDNMQRFNEIGLRSSRKFEACKEGIALKYLLPSGNSDTFFASLFDPLASHKTNSSSSSLTPDLSPCEKRSVPSTPRDCHAWTITVNDATRYTPTNQRTVSSKKYSKEKSGLIQGKSKRACDDQFSDRFRRNLASQLSGLPLSNLKRSKKKSRLSVSLPSSPLTSSRKNDVIIQKVKSRTPEAERKLVDQIVDCTVGSISKSPVLVYGNEGKVQLDRNVFLPGDKISRTPTKTSFKQSQYPTCCKDSTNKAAAFDSLTNDINTLSPSCGYNFSDSKDLSSAKRQLSNTTYNTSSPESCLVRDHVSDDRDLITDTSHVINETFTMSHDNLLSPDLTTNTSTISSAIDHTLTSAQDDTTMILDISSPSFTELDSFDESHTQASDVLISLEDNTTSPSYRAMATSSGEARSKAVDILMSTPPPLLDDSSWKENNFSKSSILSHSKDSTPADQETPLKQFQLNLLPVPDFQTPELQHYRSVLMKK